MMAGQSDDGVYILKIRLVRRSRIPVQPWGVALLVGNGAVAYAGDHDLDHRKSLPGAVFENKISFLEGEIMEELPLRVTQPEEWGTVSVDEIPAVGADANE